MKKQPLILCLALAFTYAQGMYDYNGNPLMRNGSITITPQTSSAIIASYTKTVNLDGLVDNTFGANGFSLINLGGAENQAFAGVLQPDGKILAAGYSGTGQIGGDNNCAVIRCNTNGSLDTSFGTGGIVVTDFGTTTTNHQNYACLLQPDNKILVAGYTNAFGGANVDFALVRYLSNGTQDPSFGRNGITVVPIRGADANEDYINHANAAVLQPDDKVIALGFSNKNNPGNLWAYDFALIRYNPDGKPDDSFGTDGIVVTPIRATGGDEDDNEANAGILQPDGKIIAIGWTGVTNNDTTHYTNFALVRYNVDGTLDTTFGNDGIVTTNLGLDDSTNYAYAGTLQPDDKILVAGSTNKDGGTNFDFALVRYLPDGTLDTTFGNNGIVTTDLGGANDVAYGCILQLDGKIIVTGQTNALPESISFALVRYNSNGTLDTTFGSNGIVITNPGGIDNEAYTGLLQPDGKIVTIGYSNQNNLYQFALTRYISPFTLTSFTSTYGNVGLL